MTQVTPEFTVLDKLGSKIKDQVVSIWLYVVMPLPLFLYPATNTSMHHFDNPFFVSFDITIKLKGFTLY